MTPLEQMLAEALAQAVNDEAVRLDALCAATGHFNEPPPWFHDATKALADYNWAKEQETNRVNY